MFVTASWVTAMFLFSFFVFSGCRNQPASITDESYSFFVAGHAYGNPINYQYGIYPPLKAYFEQLNQEKSLSFGVLTGDVVAKNTQAFWDSAYADIELLNIPVYIAPGNHDRGEVFKSKKNPAYFSFRKMQDLYIILDTDRWMVDGLQKIFLFNTLDTSTNIRNVFIFSHELVWWSPDNQYSKIEINYRPHYPGKTNFWHELLPKLQSLGKPVYWFAGDVGSKPECTAISYSQEESVTLISNGVGGGIKDNVIHVDLSRDGAVSFRVINLNDPTYPEMGSIEDFRF
jgi:hypothetical protein